MRKVVLLLAALLVLTPVAGADIADEIRTLDGSGNNRNHPEWGKTNTQYLRVARVNYADGIAKPVGGPPTRYVSNRIFNDSNQNLFSENGVTQWGFVWGQFMDHTFGLREEDGGENAPIAFNTTDPLETFTNTLGVDRVHRARRPHPAPGRERTPRQQINTVSSYIDGFSVYGGTADRLEWLREGPVDGKLANNGAKLLLHERLPARADARGNAAAAPPMALMGRLAGTRSSRRRSSPATSGRTRTSRSRRPTRCSRGSTTGSSRRCRARCRRGASSRSPAGWSAPSSSTSPTRSSCPRWASACRRTTGYKTNVNATPRERVRRPSATGPTA